MSVDDMKRTIENILPEIVDAYDPSTKLKRFHFY